jgi:ribosomal protein L37AE/L43A
MLTGNESKQLSDAIVALREQVYCPDCVQFIKRIPELNGVWSCKGEHLKYKANS